ncbi:MAG TPA: triphosphoribosyl-dephospho-CoA synthase [Planctomicrobium sp.]|nr:triphosphoribosyl-dephospho-CoA synthase [Planctomicrobium sp.]
MPQFPLADQIRLACQMECSAKKPGNVHPEADFNDVSYQDFMASADVIAPVLAQARETGVGGSIYDAVIKTRQMVGTNTNLGIILLLAPLAAIPAGKSCLDGIGPVLDSLTQVDAEFVYAAIRHAQPGGLGKVDEQDVASKPAIGLVEAMSLAADRDLIARQYHNRFQEVLGFGCQSLLRSVNEEGMDWETAVISTQLQLMATFPDTLIVRKCGSEIAVESQVRAQAVLNSNWRSDTDSHLEEFDRWLRNDGHRRNPGTTADLIAAILFVALRDHQFAPADVSLEMNCTRKPFV